MLQMVLFFITILTTLCSYLKEQTKRHMLLVCNPAGSDFSHSWFLLFLPYSASISALLCVYQHYKIIYIPSLIGLYIILFFPFLFLSLFSVFPSSLSVHLFLFSYPCPLLLLLLLSFNSFSHSSLFLI